MKRILLTLSLLLCIVTVYAQQSKSDGSLEYRRHWILGVQGGVAYTVGESSFGELLSPAVQASLTWHFHHAMGLRLGVGGWQGKGAARISGEYGPYAYEFGQLSADYVLDLAGMIGGYDHGRVVHPYVFAGIGAMCGSDNGEAGKDRSQFGNYWEAPKVFVSVRAGVGVDFRLSEVVSLGVEGNASMLSDRFNSKVGYNPDWHFNLLAGLKFSLGKSTRPSRAYADAKAAEEAAMTALAAEKAEAERLEAERLAREAAARAEAERLEAERLAGEAAERAEQERMALCEENSDNIYFTIGSAAIRGAEMAKLEKLAGWMAANKDFNVTVVGYADRQTGTAERNMVLSGQRAEEVRKALIALGVDAGRILADHKGDSVQPYRENTKNRVVVCTLE